MLSIRPATIKDVPLLTTLIHEPAEYERLSHDTSVHDETSFGMVLVPTRNFVPSLPSGAAKSPDMLYSSSFIPRFRGALDCFLRTSLCVRSSEGRVSVKHCSRVWLKSPGERGTFVCVGRFWTGTLRRSTFIASWAPCFSMSGREPA